MEIISEVGVPMTNGEVYALVRRRRDERNAAQHPPFCQQLQQADAHNRASSQYIASKFGSGAGGNRAGAAARGAPSARGVASPLDSANAANAVLATPAAGHLVILLTEVKLLNYLANNAHLNSHARLGDVYGPASVYEAVTTRRHRTEQEEDNAGEPEQEPAASAQEEEQDQTLGGQACAVVQSTQPGTTAHVAAVDAWLHLWEQHGQRQEAHWAKAVKQTLCPRSTSLPTNSASNAIKEDKFAVSSATATTPATQEDGTAANARPLSSYRVLLAAPTTLPFAATLSTAVGHPALVKLEHDEEEDGRYAGSAAAAAAAVGKVGLASSVDAEALHMTDEELLRLVVARPQSLLNVYQLLDHLEERFGYDEARLTAWCDTLGEIFAKSDANVA